MTWTTLTKQVLTQEISYTFLKNLIFRVCLKELPSKFLIFSQKANLSCLFEKTNNLLYSKFVMLVQLFMLG